MGPSRREVIASGTVLASATLAGCFEGADDDEDPVDPTNYQYDREHPDDEEAARDTTLLITQDVARDEIFDPIATNGAYARQVFENIYDNLYEWNDKLGLEPKVATSMPDVERDGTRYLFEIHDGIEFHNGDELTASDVVHSFTAPVEEEMETMGNYTMIESAEAIDDHQLQVDLEYPYGTFTEETMRIAIVPEEARTEDREAFQTNPIGSGPFVWSDFQYNEYVELERWDDYWDEPQPYAAEIRYETAQDGANRVSQIRAGDTDIIYGVPETDWDVLDDEDGVHLHAAQNIGFMFLAFNCNEDAVTADTDVRRGVTHTFSGSDFVETQMPDTGEPLTSPLSPAVNEQWDFPHDEWEEELYPQYDPDRAAELLEGSVPDDWSPTILAPPGIFRPEFAEEVATRLTETGYDAEVQTRDLGPFYEEIYNNPDEWDMYVSGWANGVDPDTLIRPNYHDSAFKITQGHGYDNDDFHDNIEAARRTTDQDERHDLYVDVIEEILEEVPALPVYVKNVTMASRDHVRDLHAHPTPQTNPRIVSDYGNVWTDE